MQGKTPTFSVFHICYLMLINEWLTTTAMWLGNSFHLCNSHFRR